MREDTVKAESSELLEVKLVIDGQDVELIPHGESKNYDKYKEPQIEGIIASVYVRKGWQGKGISSADEGA